MKRIYLCMCVLLCVCVVKVQALALELQSLHFSANQESTRKVASELRAILISVEGACLAHENGTVSCKPGVPITLFYAWKIPVYNSTVYIQCTMYTVYDIHCMYLLRLLYLVYTALHSTIPTLFYYLVNPNTMPFTFCMYICMHGMGRFIYTYIVHV